MTFASLLKSLIDLFRWFVTVAPWEAGLRVRLGNRVKVLEPGPYLKIPVIDRVFVQSTRLRFSAVPSQTLTTADGKALTVAGAIGYEIRDIRLLYDTLHHAEAAIESEAQGLISEFVVTHCLADCTPSVMQEEVVSSLQLEKYGLGGVKFIITTFVSVKTYRLITGEPRDYTTGPSLQTQYADGEDQT